MKFATLLFFALFWCGITGVFAWFAGRDICRV